MLLDLHGLIWAAIAASTTINGTASVITTSAPSGMISSAATINGYKEVRIYTRPKLWHTNWRNPGNWTAEQKTRPARRASISNNWTAYPYSYPGVEIFVGSQPGVLRYWPSLVPTGAPGNYNYDLGTALDADPANSQLDGHPYTIWLSEAHFGSLQAPAAIGATSITVSNASSFPASGYVTINTDMFSYSGKTATQLTGIPSTGKYSIDVAAPSGSSVRVPTYGTFAIDIRNPAARAIQIAQLVSHFGSWAHGLHNDYLTSLQWLETAYDNPVFSQQWLDPPTNTIPNPDYYPTMWSEWDTGYKAFFSELRAAWPQVICVGQQFHLTSLTPSVDGLFVEGYPWQWQTDAQHIANGLAHGHPEQWVLEFTDPELHSASNHVKLWNLAIAMNAWISWNRDDDMGLYGTESGGQLYRYLNGTLLAGAVTINGNAGAIAAAAPAGTISAGSVEVFGAPLVLVASAPTGTRTGSFIVAGAPVTATFSAPVGSITTGAATITGAPEPASFTSPDGTIATLNTIVGLPAIAVWTPAPGAALVIPAFTIPGAPRAASFTAPAGATVNGGAIIAGTVTVGAWAAPAGTPSAGVWLIPGAPRTASFTAPAGALLISSATANGAAITAIFSAPAGSITSGSATIPGATTGASFQSAAGTIATAGALNGLPAQLVWIVPAGALAISPATIPGTTTVATFSAPTGTASITAVIIPGVPAVATFGAIAGIVAVPGTIPGQPAMLVWTAPVGSTSHTIPGQPAMLVWTAPVGAASAPGAVIVAGTSTVATFGAPAGTLTATVGPSIMGSTTVAIFSASAGTLTAVLPGEAPITLTGIAIIDLSITGPGAIIDLSYTSDVTLAEAP